MHIHYVSSTAVGTVDSFSINFKRKLQIAYDSLYIGKGLDHGAMSLVDARGDHWILEGFCSQDSDLLITAFKEEIDILTSAMTSFSYLKA